MKFKNEKPLFEATKRKFSAVWRWEPNFWVQKNYKKIIIKSLQRKYKKFETTVKGKLVTVGCEFSTQWMHFRLEKPILKKKEIPENMRKLVIWAVDLGFFKRCYRLRSFFRHIYQYRFLMKFEQKTDSEAEFFLQKVPKKSEPPSLDEIYSSQKTCFREIQKTLLH